MAPTTPRHTRAVSINGPALQAIRQALGVAVDDVAAALHCSKQYLYMLESGSRRQCSPLFLANLKTALGIADHRALLACPYGEHAHPEQGLAHDSPDVDTGSLPLAETGGEVTRVVPGVVPVPRRPTRHRAGAR